MILTESSTYLMIGIRHHEPTFVEMEYNHENPNVEVNSTYLWIVPSVGLAVAAFVLLIFCVRRNNTTSRRESSPETNRPITQNRSTAQDWGDNFAYETNLQRPARVPSKRRTASAVETADSRPVHFHMDAKAKSLKVRPVGMATRIPHTQDSNSKVKMDKSYQLPTVVSIDKTQVDLIKDIKEFHAKQRMASISNFNVDESSFGEDGKQTTDNVKSAAIQRQKNSGSIRILANKNTPLPGRPTVVEDDIEEQDSAKYSTTKTLPDNFGQYITLESTYSNASSSSTDRQQGSLRARLDGRSMSRKRTPRLSDAGTQWAIENHLTRRKSSFKSRLSSLRYSKLPKKHINCVSLDDLPKELRESASSLDSTATQPLSIHSYGSPSPYKLQFRNSLRPGRKILYRNGTRKNDRSVLRKSKKWTKNFEMGVVEESPSFYMSFDSPLPPSIEGKIQL